MEKISDIYKKYNEIINYMIFGILATIISLGVKWGLLFTVLDQSNGFELQVAVVVSWILAFLFAYITSRKYVFKSKNQNKSKEFFSFFVARITTLLIEMFIMWFFVTLLKLNSDLWVIFFTILSQCAVVIGNYVFSKLFVFKKADK